MGVARRARFANPDSVGTFWHVPTQPDTRQK